MSAAEYAVLLRVNAGRTVQEPQQYRTALDTIRALTLSDRLSDADLGAEVRLVFQALKQVQDELDG
ncbi:hypothetical protein AB0C29_12250 [Actinoplanes sp. NPDC048791]|uniref:hypothetical protein n=1 Tax=Actinoplanes sp. NPDC048791 TaxID=3154623 RepID=UPI0033C1216B